jgi:hypothetical protein
MPLLARDRGRCKLFHFYEANCISDRAAAHEVRTKLFGYRGAGPLCFLRKGFEHRYLIVGHLAAPALAARQGVGFKALFLPNEPLANRGDAVVDLLAKNDVCRRLCVAPMLVGR